VSRGDTHPPAFGGRCVHPRRRLDTLIIPGGKGLRVPQTQRSLSVLVNARPEQGALPLFAPALTDWLRLDCSMVAASRHTGDMPMILPGVIDLRTRKAMLLSQMMLFKPSEILASQLQNVVDFRRAVRFSYPNTLGPMK